MNAFPLMAEAAAAFRARLLAEPAARPVALPPDSVAAGACALAPDAEGARPVWDNLLVAAPRFRRAHVETFVVPGRISVLHVCVFPPLDDAAPIFGFDMIAGPARVTGVFLDLSPTVPGPPRPSLSDVMAGSAVADFAIRRERPDWGDIFSDDLLAVRPVDLDEVRRAVVLAHQALDALLAAPRCAHVEQGGVEQGGQAWAGQARAGQAWAGQARYIAGQRRNPHTQRMLASFVGAEPAARFIADVLFPAPHLLEQAASLV